MRSSVAASSRSSQAPSQPASAALLTRLAEKKKEFEAVDALQHASALFLKRLEGLADDCEVMADAGVVHGQVLAQWPQMFRTLDMFLAAREAAAMAAEGAERDANTSYLPPGGRLVRVPLDELQQAEQK
ncbi:hypothetical protein BC834DRAFT_974903 [Gloeopeniophorella convolvens]|nr:hypothetical protein BC834DRAFT_974903 [Gloeopeniophorella convolvens]